VSQFASRAAARPGDVDEQGGCRLLAVALDDAAKFIERTGAHRLFDLSGLHFLSDR
jgi:hypothetical protein